MLKNSIAARSLQKRELKSSPADLHSNLHSRIIQKAKYFWEKSEKKLEDVVVER